MTHEQKEGIAILHAISAQHACIKISNMLEQGQIPKDVEQALEELIFHFGKSLGIDMPELPIHE